MNWYAIRYKHFKCVWVGDSWLHSERCRVCRPRRSSCSRSRRPRGARARCRHCIVVHVNPECARKSGRVDWEGLGIEAESEQSPSEQIMIFQHAQSSFKIRALTEDFDLPALVFHLCDVETRAVRQDASHDLFGLFDEPAHVFRTDFIQ